MSAPISETRFQNSRGKEDTYWQSQHEKQQPSILVQGLLFVGAGLSIAAGLEFNSIIHDIGSYSNLFYLGALPLAYKCFNVLTKDKHIDRWAFVFFISTIATTILLCHNFSNPEDVWLPSWSFAPGFVPFLLLLKRRFQDPPIYSNTMQVIEPLVRHIHLGYLPHELEPGRSVPLELDDGARREHKKQGSDATLIGERLFGCPGRKGLIGYFNTDPEVRSQVCRRMATCLLYYGYEIKEIIDMIRISGLYTIQESGLYKEKELADLKAALEKAAAVIKRA